MDLMYLLTIILVTVPLVIYAWFKHRHDFWKRHNFPYIPAKFLWGNVKKSALLHETIAIEFDHFYKDERTKNEPYVGLFSFHQPILLIRDPELIKNVLIKDFQTFPDRQWTSNPHADPLSYYNLFFLKGQIWKHMRQRLTPVFTSGKIKQMFPIIKKVGIELSEYMQDMNAKAMSYCNDIKDLCGKYTTDVISLCVFGIQANSIKDPNSEFRKNGRELVEFSKWRAIEFNSFFLLPDIIRLCGFKVFSPKMTNILRTSIAHKIDEREKSQIIQNDFIDVLVTLKNEDQNKSSTTYDLAFKGDVLYAQAAVFFIAGFETSSATMSFALYELAMQADLQRRLRNEIKEKLEENNQDINYDFVQKLEYLDMVVKETLRLYPPLPFVDRVCVPQNGETSYSLQLYGPHTLPKNVGIFIPVYSLHTDPKYFVDPMKFDPERFSPENRDSINPYTYLPFGRGPRNCIGERFGLLQVKVGLINILKNHFFKPGPNTIKQMRLDKNALLLAAEGGIHLESVYDPLFKL